MPISQALNDTEGDFIVVWYDYDDKEHCKRFRRFRDAEAFSDEIECSTVHHVRKRDDGTLYRAMV